MAARGAQLMPGARDPVAHLVFTDGLASVSVFVEPKPADPDAATTPTEGRVGSSNAFSTVVDGHRVTAVGEVPPNTVRFIANSVKSGPSPRISAGPRP
jgi:sigma-E factor negative regulatory protein RseB